MAFYDDGNPFSTKGEIMKAFVELLSEKSYADITVTDIVKKAKIARASFYRNFSSISEVVDVISDDMMHEFETEILPVLTSNDERKWRELLFHIFYRFSRLNDAYPFNNAQNAAILFQRGEGKIKEINGIVSDESIQSKYGRKAKMALIFAFVQTWIAGGKKETPEELIDYIMTFITAF